MLFYLPEIISILYRTVKQWNDVLANVFLPSNIETYEKICMQACMTVVTTNGFPISSWSMIFLNFILPTIEDSTVILRSNYNRKNTLLPNSVFHFKKIVN